MYENPEVAFGGTAQMLGLIDNIYSAVERPEFWVPVMEQVSRAVQGESVALYAGAPDARAPAIVAFHGAPMDVWEEYAAHYAAINPIYPACQRAFSPEETWYSDRALSAAVYESSEFYNDFYKPNKMYYSMGLRIELPGAPAASISIQRQHAGGPFPEVSEIVAQTLRPHLQRALSLSHQMGLMQTAALGLEAAVDAFAQAVIGIDCLGRVAFCSELAVKFLHAGNGLRLRQGEISCVQMEDTRKLRATLLSVLEGGSGGAMHVQRSGRPALRVTVCPFRGNLRGHSARLVGLIYISDPAQTVASRAVILRDLYKLTPAECRVADLLFSACEVRKVAEELSFTLETARFHVKQILRKTGTRRQSELIRLLASFPGK